MSAEVISACASTLSDVASQLDWQHSPQNASPSVPHHPNWEQHSPVTQEPFVGPHSLSWVTHPCSARENVNVFTSLDVIAAWASSMQEIAKNNAQAILRRRPAGGGIMLYDYYCLLLLLHEVLLLHHYYVSTTSTECVLSPFQSKEREDERLEVDRRRR